MAVLSVRLLGPPHIRSGDTELRLPSVKAQALLYYLAAQPHRTFSRSHLVALLWEESAEAEGRNSLSTVLTRLRHALPVFPVAAEGDTLVWRPGDAAWVDTDVFAATGATLAALSEAAALWRGSFLDGFTIRDSLTYDEWLAQSRQHWEQRYLDLMGRLADAAATARAWPLAQQAARQALAVDPLQERFHRALMTALYQTGDRAAALAEYEACARLLDRELGATPDRATRAVFEAIRDDSLPRIAAAAPGPLTLAPRVVRAPSLPLLERQREMEKLLDHLAQTEARAAGGDAPDGRLVVVEGEAGIGKSRLLAEVSWRLSQGNPPGWTVIEGHCYEAERSLPYHPFVDALNPVVAGLGVQGLGLSDVWLAELARLLPDLAALRPGLGQAFVIDPSQDQRRLFEAVARFLMALPAPLLFILDDLHWADAGTLQLLSYLVRHLAEYPIQFAAAVRTEDTDAALQTGLWRLEREGRLSTLNLARLSPAGTTALLRQMGHGDVEGLAARLYRETEGNPLFTVEVVRSLQESGSLRQGRPEARLTLPASVSAVIQGRLVRLSPAARELLAAASVYRRDFSFEAARAVSGQAENAALDALDELLAGHLLTEESGQASLLGDDVGYAFSHDKVREVVYAELSHARATTLHRRAVAALGDATDPRTAERLAYHAVHGRLWEDGLRWSTQAGIGATAVFDFATAALLYQQALDCLAHVPMTEALRRQNVELRLMLARVAFYIEPGRLMGWLAPAETDAQVLSDDELLSFVWLAQGAALYIQGRFREARPRLERLIPLMERAGDSLQVARAKNILARTLAMMGESAAGLALLEEAAARLDMVGAHNDALISRGMIGAERAFLGDFDTALKIVEAVYAESLRQADPGAIAAAADFVQVVHHCWGRWAEALDWGQRALEPSQRAANRVYERNVYIFLGLPRAYLGDIEGGRAALERAIGLGAEFHSTVFMGRTHAWLAEILLLRGDAEAARRAAATGLSIAAEAGARYDHGLARRALGKALAGLGDLGAAETELGAALGELRGLGALPAVGRTLAVVADVAAAQGDARAADTARAEARDIFTRLHMDWDLSQIP